MIFIAGPCQIEDREMMLPWAETLFQTFLDYGGKKEEFFFKSSFDKANRTSLNSKRGIGFDNGLSVLWEIKEKIGCQILTDVHDPWQCGPVAEIADVLQIPAFLSRQTDLLIAASSEDLIVNVKKGQWMAPWDIGGILTKTEKAKQVWITERGTCFGYNRLVVDFTGIQYMRQYYDVPIIFDATHSVQLPGLHGEHSGGNRNYVNGMVRAAAAMGVDGIFLEAHPDPENAPSDGPNQITLYQYKEVLKDLNYFWRKESEV